MCSTDPVVSTDVKMKEQEVFPSEKENVSLKKKSCNVDKQVYFKAILKRS